MIYEKSSHSLPGQNGIWTKFLASLHSQRRSFLLLNLWFCKVQLILQCLFGIFDSPAKNNQNIRLYYYGTSIQIVFVRFLRELKPLKRHFEINWALAKWIRSKWLPPGGCQNLLFSRPSFTIIFRPKIVILDFDRIIFFSLRPLNCANLRPKLVILDTYRTRAIISRGLYSF